MVPLRCHPSLIDAIKKWCRYLLHYIFYPFTLVFTDTQIIGKNTNTVVAAIIIQRYLSNISQNEISNLLHKRLSLLIAHHYIDNLRYGS